MPDRLPTYLQSHVLQSDRLTFDLAAQLADLRAGMGGHDRHSITLVKEGALNVVLTALRAGAALDEHAAPGPTTIHVLDGRVRVRTGSDEQDLGPGALVAFDTRVSHAVAARQDAALLITVVLAAQRGSAG